MLSALSQSSDENGWAHLGTFGSYLTKLQPDFDARAYGFRKLSDLVKSHHDIFVTEERAVPSQAKKQLYVKPR
ncbi:OST-HTH/LOTUS domain-containing protein [Paraburkholderia sp. BL17N1]|uniref:OST-HTH/LOTUS domain-containing protein n=1 Tax=Paraburkholderia sp. BL17N1 TaxID=1938798 RepID=UPI001F542F9F|nr:OST-HTH/LOTUS domain-containing protein [Paraburkholderia sp. BL17N1]